MAKKLELIFKDGAGKTAKILPKHFDENLDAETLQEAMEAIAANNMFADGNDIAKYAVPVKARFVDTVTTDVYVAEEDSAE